MTLGNLADAQRLAGDLQAAEANAIAVVELAAESADENPQLLGTANVTLGNVMMSAGRHGEAAEHYGQARALMVQALGGELRCGRLEEALAMFELRRFTYARHASIMGADPHSVNDPETR